MNASINSDDGVALSIRVQRKAAADRIILEEDGRVRVAVTAPPADGAANKAVCVVLAKHLGLAKSKVSVRSGLRSRDKVIQVNGLGEDEAMRRLSAR